MQAEANVQAKVQAIIDEIHKVLATQGKSLPGRMLRVLECCLQQHPAPPYRQMVNETYGNPDSLKEAGYKLNKILSDITGQKVTKDNFGSVVWPWYQARVGEHNAGVIGRQDDLDKLSDAITGRGRLLCIYGLPSIGKTQLVTALRQRLREINDKDSFFKLELSWEVEKGLTIDDLYRHVCSRLPNDIEIEQSDAVRGLRQILRHCRHRLLLVIEGADSLYDSNYSDASFRQDGTSKGYERWLQLLTQTYDLHSCVIWVSRRRPSCLLVSGNHVYSRQLQPLQPDDAVKLLQEENLPHIPEEDLYQLTEFCGRNPGVLKLASLKIRTERHSSVAEVMRMPLKPKKYPEDRSWLHAIGTLTLMEQNLLSWLLLLPDSSLERAMQEAFRSTSQSLQDMLSDLQQRGFVERHPAGYYELQSPWLRHIVARFTVERLASAFWSDASEALEIIGQYPLVSPRAAAWERYWHWDHVLYVLDGALNKVNIIGDSWTKGERGKRFEAFFEKLHSSKRTNEPWLIGNLLTMAVALKLPLNGLKVSGMTIRYADLRGNHFKNVTFQNCAFVDTALPIKVHGRLAIALSPNGTTLAVGDEQGRIFCWRLEHNTFRLEHFTRVPDSPEASVGVTHLAFGNERVLVVAANQQIYYWWLSSENSFSSDGLDLIQKVSQPVSCLSAQGENRIAVGLMTGEIIFWHDLEGTKKRTAHRKPVKTLAFISEGAHLLSIGYGDRILEWDIALDPIPEERPSEGALFITGAFQGVSPVIAYASDGSWGIRLSNGARQKFAFKVDGDLMRFSRNGQYLAVVVNGAVRVFSTADLTSHTTIPVDHTPTDLMISNDGGWLLIKGSLKNITQTQLWNVKTHQRWWDLQSSTKVDAPVPSGNMLLQRCQVKDSSAEQLYFTDYHGANFAK